MVNPPPRKVSPVVLLERGPKRGSKLKGEELMKRKKRGVF